MVMSQSIPAAREVAESIGDPVFGLAGPLARQGVLFHSRGGDGRLLGLRYDNGNSRSVQVTTGTSPQGGTTILVREVITSATHDLRPPFTISVSERLVMVPVLAVPTQFRVIETSNGHWLAAGGFKKRHIRLGGSPGTAVDDIELTAVVLP